jgi:hypothetical protein
MHDCQECGRSFERDRGLRVHEQVKHPGLPCRIEGCEEPREARQSVCVEHRRERTRRKMALRARTRPIRERLLVEAFDPTAPISYKDAHKRIAKVKGRAAEHTCPCGQPAQTIDRHEARASPGTSQPPDAVTERGRSRPGPARLLTRSAGSPDGQVWGASEPVNGPAPPTGRSGAFGVSIGVWTPDRAGWTLRKWQAANRSTVVETVRSSAPRITFNADREKRGAMNEGTNDASDDEREVEDHADTHDPDSPPTRAATWDEVIQCANTAFLVGGHWHRVAGRLTNIIQAQGLDDTDPLLMPLRRGLNFFLDARTGDQANVDLAPTGFQPSALRSIRSVPSQDVDAWRRIADEVDHPAARAHFHDLLFKRGGPTAVRHAAAAVTSYMDVARVEHYTVPAGEEAEERQFNWNAHSRNVAMGRALSLRHVIAADPASAHLVEDAQRLALERLGQLLSETSQQIGDLLLLVRLLTRSRRTLLDTQAASLKKLIESAIDKHSDRDDIVDALVAQLLLFEPRRAEELNRLRVQVRLDLAASQSHGGVRMIHLERAASLARDYQFQDLHDEAIRQMQRAAPEDLDFQTIATDSTLPAEVVAAEIVQASDGASWRDALTSWLQTGSPAGGAQGNRTSAENLARTSLVSQLGMPTVVYGRDGLPRWTAASEEERREHELSRFEMLAIQFHGLVLAEGLETIAARHGIPDVDELALFLSHNGQGDFELSRAFAKALRRFWAGDFEGAMMTSALRVEAGARHLAVALDEAAYVTSRQNAPGVYVGIAQLVELLEKHGLDEDWQRFLLTYFVAPSGRTLRHDLAHGFGLEEDEPRVEAALSLRALGLFVYAAWEPGKDTAPATRVLDVHATGLVEAAALFVRHLRRGVPVRALLRHEAASIARLTPRWRR